MKRFHNEYDNFTGTELYIDPATNEYVTREGKRGRILQQEGTKVVHVYGSHRLAELGNAFPTFAPAHGQPQLFDNANSRRGSALVNLSMAKVYNIVRDRITYMCMGEQSIDPDAVCQNVCVELEKAMGVFPNIDAPASSDDIVMRHTGINTGPAKQTSPEVSEVAARLIKVTERTIQNAMDRPNGASQLVKDIRKLAASCLSQDEIKG